MVKIKENITSTEYMLKEKVKLDAEILSFLEKVGLESFDSAKIDYATGELVLEVSTIIYR